MCLAAPAALLESAERKRCVEDVVAVHIYGPGVLPNTNYASHAVSALLPSLFAEEDSVCRSTAAEDAAGSAPLPTAGVIFELWCFDIEGKSF
jgi:hypothetical protein